MGGKNIKNKKIKIEPAWLNKAQAESLGRASFFLPSFCSAPLGPRKARAEPEPQILAREPAQLDSLTPIIELD